MMKNNKLKLIVVVMAVLPLLALSNLALADQVQGTLTTGISGSNGTTVNGTVVVAPTASPTAATYTSAQSVTLTAAGSSSINYTIDGSTPTCSTGTVYSGAISVGSSEIITAVSCYLDSSNVAHPSGVVSFAYTINIPAPSGGTSSGGGGYYIPPTTNPVWDSVNVGLLDLSIMASEWGQTGSNLSADLNHDGVVDILDLSILAADWNGQ